MTASPAPQPQPQSQPAPKQLYRTETNQVIAGVAGGLGEYFEIDPVLIRVLFILLTVMGGSGILLYILLWLVLPEKSKVSLSTEETMRQNAEAMSSRAKEFVEDAQVVTQHNPRSCWRIPQWTGVIFFCNFTLSRFESVALHLDWWGLYIITKGVTESVFSENPC